MRRGGRYNACSALSELAFRNEENCIAIVQSKGGLAGIVELLRGSDERIQEDAALVVNNCAAFCEDMCTTIVACPGLLCALKDIVMHRGDASKGAKYVAVGALNCLSRCAAARPELLAHGVVEAIVPVLSEKGQGDRHDAHVARATMAIANLCGLLRDDMFEDEAMRLLALRTTGKLRKGAAVWLAHTFVD